MVQNDIHQKSDDESSWFVRRRSREWHAAWKGLAAQSGDADYTAMNPIDGQIWQYMGSWKRAGRWEHTFRHRNHPPENKWIYLAVLATPRWSAEQERKRRTLH